MQVLGLLAIVVASFELDTPDCSCSQCVGGLSRHEEGKLTCGARDDRCGDFCQNSCKAVTPSKSTQQIECREASSAPSQLTLAQMRTQLHLARCPKPQKCNCWCRCTETFVNLPTPEPLPGETFTTPGPFSPNAMIPPAAKYGQPGPMVSLIQKSNSAREAFFEVSCSFHRPGVPGPSSLQLLLRVS
mmetsp:Transcript_20692/g.46047  ORF Transcript_20692/g.46047 Transcript_20692/m.46047 type:complete len:187 (+) Transcript_20692:117-677(+)